MRTVGAALTLGVACGEVGRGVSLGESEGEDTGDVDGDGSGDGGNDVGSEDTGGIIVAVGVTGT
ncbi:MAG: hypothetical protein AAB588_06545 [Patescibacteria group bacterium]